MNHTLESRYKSSKLISTISWIVGASMILIQVSCDSSTPEEPAPEPKTLYSVEQIKEAAYGKKIKEATNILGPYDYDHFGKGAAIYHYYGITINPETNKPYFLTSLIKKSSKVINVIMHTAEDGGDYDTKTVTYDPNAFTAARIKPKKELIVGKWLCRDDNNPNADLVIYTFSEDGSLDTITPSEGNEMNGKYKMTSDSVIEFNVKYMSKLSSAGVSPYIDKYANLTINSINDTKLTMTSVMRGSKNKFQSTCRRS